MPELKLQKLPDRTSVKLAISVSPELNKALQGYAVLYHETYGQEETVVELIPFMLDSFIHGDRTFAKAFKKSEKQGEATNAGPATKTGAK